MTYIARYNSRQKQAAETHWPWRGAVRETSVWHFPAKPCSNIILVIPLHSAFIRFNYDSTKTYGGGAPTSPKWPNLLMVLASTEILGPEWPVIYCLTTLEAFTNPQRLNYFYVAYIKPVCTSQETHYICAKDQRVNAVWGISRSLLWEPYGTLSYGQNPAFSISRQVKWYTLVSLSLKG
jgi:hypothetical protein